MEERIIMNQKQTVLVTGGCGFIGTNFVRLLVGSGVYHVVNLDALTYAANSLSLADLEGHPDYEFVKGNITDRELVSSLFAKYQPVGVFHHTYGLPTVITNCSNNYGPYQFPEKLIPLMIMNALSGKPLPVYGDGSNVRDWLYVEDHCKAIKLAFEKGTPGEVYVVGGNNEQKNLNLVNQICSILDDVAPSVEIPQLREQGLKSYKDLIRFVTDRPGHDQRYAIDSAKIRRELGWQAEVGFEAGLRRTVDWYLSNPDWVNQVSSGSYGEWIKKNYAWRAEKESK